jgi:CDGSH-type Zn-finger protein
MSDSQSEQSTNRPYKVDLLEGYRYAWCSCGLSNFQPFCDGSHTMSKEGLKPIIFNQTKDETVFLCGCKKTLKGPRCDGSHNLIKLPNPKD